MGTSSNPDYKGGMDSSLNMALGYFSEWKLWFDCSRGLHRWSDWNAYAGLRICTHCQLEMPESKKGEKNYRDYNEHAKAQIDMYKKLIKVDGDN